MSLSPEQRSEVSGPFNEESAFWKALLYRWFVLYNPAYLLSAAFVFAGCFLWSKGVVHQDSLTSTLGIPMLAELYAVSLIGGAALLTRIGQRRPAVILSLIFVAYQWDTTLHTEACAYLGSVGRWAALAWLAIFVAKLFAMGWALRIRMQRRLLAAALIAGAGLVIAPRVLPDLGDYEAGAWLAAWIFSLISLYDGPSLSSVVSLDAWGQTVLRRATNTAWGLSGALIVLHVFIWKSNASLSLAPTMLALPLVAIPRLRRERDVWAVALGTSILTLLVAPSAFSVIAILASGAFALRTLAPKISPRTIPAAPREWKPAPYRATGPIRNEPENTPLQRVPVTLTTAERLRCASGALFSAYLGLWSIGWSHGAPTHHLLALDAALTLLAVAAAWRSQARGTFLLPLAITLGHFVVQSRLIPIPSSEAQLGEAAIAFGFALLGAALFVSYKLRAFGTVPAASVDAPDGA